MKKLIVLLLCTVLFSMLAACGGSGESNDGEGRTEGTTAAAQNGRGRNNAVNPHANNPQAGNQPANNPQAGNQQTNRPQTEPPQANTTRAAATTAEAVGGTILEGNYISRDGTMTFTIAGNRFTAQVDGSTIEGSFTTRGNMIYITYPGGEDIESPYTVSGVRLSFDGMDFYLR